MPKGRSFISCITPVLFCWFVSLVANDIDEMDSGRHLLRHTSVQCADLGVDVGEEGKPGLPTDLHNG